MIQYFALFCENAELNAKKCVYRSGVLWLVLVVDPSVFDAELALSGQTMRF